MAAEHAARHHHNLLEVTQLLLLPILDADRCFLNDAERFVLLAAVLLHDCGHTLDALPAKGDTLVPLFPTEIRDLHHFLSWYRLTDSRHASNLHWDPCAQFAREVAYLCLHHRRRTGWQRVNGDSEFRCPYLDEAFAPPMKATVRHCLDTSVDLPKLVALLRLIDGCDNQSRRVGPAPHVDAFQQLLQQDKQTHLARVRSLADACHSYAHGNSKLPGSEWVKQVHRWVPESENAAAPSRPPDICWDTRHRLAAGGCSDPTWAALWTETARALDEVHLRDRQFFHFIKHLVVRWIRVHPRADFAADACWSFVIELEGDPDHVRYLDCEKFREEHACYLGPKTLHRWLLDEMASEVGEPNVSGPVQYLANAARRQVCFTFGWHDRPDCEIVLAAEPSD